MHVMCNDCRLTPSPGAVQVAHAVKVGDIGECESAAEAKVRLAEVEAEVKEQANERHAQIAKADLAMNLVKIQCAKDEEMRRVEAEMEPKRRGAELQAQLNKLDGIKQQARRCVIMS